MWWRTDQHLKLIAVTSQPSLKKGVLPVLGQVINRTRRSQVLDPDAHVQALQGKPAKYRVRIVRQWYEVQVVPRMGSGKKIIGVLGTLKEESARGDAQNAAKSGSRDSLFKTVKQLTRRRGRNSFRSAVDSLQLAKAVADSAQRNLEITQERLAKIQQTSIVTGLRAEEELQRIRVLTDASEILDSSFDRPQIFGRVGELLTLRFADWCVLYVVENGQIVRLMGHHRDSRAMAKLDRVFPPINEVGVTEWEFLGSINRIPQELFNPTSSRGLREILPTGSLLGGLRRPSTLRGALRSLIQTPIVSRKRVLGFLILGSNDAGHPYAPPDLQMARELSHRIGQACESCQLYDQANKEIALRREVEARLRVFNLELERRIKERTGMLEEATREANSFAYTVAHDLRAPLRAIAGFCHILKEDYSAAMDEVGRTYLDRVVSSARRMDSLIHDLLDYARLNRAEILRGIVDLDEVLGQVLEAMRGDLEERKARVEVKKPLGRVIGQVGVLGQAVTNLVSNAGKFVAPGVAPEIHIYSERHDGRIRLMIEDNGIGIAPEHHDRIFGIFERLNSEEDYPGTGIGLAIVRRAVERLSGSVGVSSKLGQGSRFWIELPFA